MKFTKKNSRKQEKAQRKWELERKVDDSDTASVTSRATSESSSDTASTAVDDEAPVKESITEVKGVDEVGDTSEQTDTLAGRYQQLTVSNVQTKAARPLQRNPVT